jgi:MFS family permease
MLILGQWYQRSEQSSRAGTFCCFNGVGAAVGGILFFGVGQATGPFAIWRIILLLAGGLTVCWGVLLLFLLPNPLMTAKYFSPSEKATLIARTRQNQTGFLNRNIKTAQIKEALLDPQIWLLFLFVLLNETINGGLCAFNKLLVLGISEGDALLTTAYGIPTGAWQVIWVFSGPWLASRFSNIRTYIMAIYVLPTIIATALLWKVPHAGNKGLLMALYISGSYVASLVIALQLPANNVAGYTKPVTATAFVFLSYCVGNIIGPHAFLAEEAPTYQTGCIVTMGCASGQVLVAFCLRALLIKRNRRRDDLYGRVVEGGDGSGAMEDKTDFENTDFRYSY